MSRPLGRLAFWKKRDPGETTGEIAKCNRLLRDFVYLDVALISSYLEQLVGGVPHETQVSRDHRGSGEVGISTPFNMPFFQINFQGSENWGHQENQTIYWSRYARLERALRDAGALIDLMQSQESTAALQPNAIFCVDGHTFFQPDWSDWQSGMSMVKLVVGKLRQVMTLTATQQEQSDASEMLPVLYDPKGKPVALVSRDALSQMVPDNLPDEPPDNIRRLFKPSGVRITLHASLSGGSVTFEGNAPLGNFTPHRVGRYLLGPVEEYAHMLGLVSQRKQALVEFIPLAVFVRIR